jgi:hypothetical protein
MEVGDGADEPGCPISLDGEDFSTRTVDEAMIPTVGVESDLLESGENVLEDEGRPRRVLTVRRTFTNGTATRADGRLPVPGRIESLDGVVPRFPRS